MCETLRKITRTHKGAKSHKDAKGLEGPKTAKTTGVHIESFPCTIGPSGTILNRDSVGPSGQVYGDLEEAW